MNCTFFNNNKRNYIMRIPNTLKKKKKNLQTNIENLFDRNNMRARENKQTSLQRASVNENIIIIEFEAKWRQSCCFFSTKKFCSFLLFFNFTFI